MTGRDERARPGRRDRQYTAALVTIGVLFAGLVLYKGALLKRPQGDFNCFARSAWAIRHGGEHLYRVADNNGWHYNYPPLFAILMTPFADPPRRDFAATATTLAGLGATPTGAAALHAVAALPASPPLVPVARWYLPHPVSLVIFYFLNVLLLAGCVHLLAGAVEKLVPPAADAAEAHRRWWRWRVGPVLACTPAIALNLVRGQVQILLLLLVCGLIVGLLSRRSWLAGMCIGGAIVLKLFPAFLLLVPVVRRDGRCLAGSVLALVLGLAVIPAVVLGPGMTVKLYQDFGEVLLGPALGLRVDPQRAKELIDATATQSQSFQVVLHKTLHLGAQQVPPRPAGWVKLVHWLLGGLMTLALVVGRDRLGRAEGLALVARLGLLALLMVLLCPVCHLHYFTLMVPLVLALLVKHDVERPGRQHTGLILLSLGLILALSLPMIPGLGILRNVGMPMLAALTFWVVGYGTRWDRIGSGGPVVAIKRAA